MKKDIDKILIQWEITPTEEKRYNIKLIPYLLIALICITGSIFLYRLSQNNLDTLFNFLIQNWQNGRYGIASLIIFTIVSSLGIITWLFIIWIKRWKARYPEKVTITSNNIIICNHNGVEITYPWHQFKGFIQENWLMGLNFGLIHKNAFPPYFYPPMISVRCEKNNSHQVSIILKQFLPDISNRYNKAWKILAIIISLILGIILQI